MAAEFAAILKWIGADMAGDVIWKGSKEALRAAIEAFSKETGKEIGGRAVDAIFNLLPASEDDERMIKSALRLISDRDVQEAWFDKLNSLDDPANPEQGRRFKEYVRRLVVEETPEETEANITDQAGMTDPVWSKYVLAMDIKFKADQAEVSPVKDWVMGTGARIMAGIKASRDEANTKLETVATNLGSLRAQRRLARGQV